MRHLAFNAPPVLRFPFGALRFTRLSDLLGLHILALALQRRLFQLQVDFGYLLKANPELLSLARDSGPPDECAESDRSANLGVFGRRLRVSSGSSAARLPVNTCPSSAALLSHSAAFILEYVDSPGALTAGTYVIPVSAL